VNFSLCLDLALTKPLTLRSSEITYYFHTWSHAIFNIPFAVALGLPLYWLGKKKLE
jgi:hypothetical protein